MGITGLWDVLGEGEIWHVADYAADFFKKHNRPLRIAVDEACWRFTNLNAEQVRMIHEGEPAANPIEKVIFQRIYRLLRLSIQLIFVDDGPKRPWKRGKRGGGKLDYELVRLTRQLLDHMKVPHHRAPAEAEAECARMQAEGIVDAVWSDDGDAFMFGCETLIRQHKNGGKIVKDHIRIYRAEVLRTKHDMDSESLVLFAMLAGGDYDVQGLRGCGPKTAAIVARRSFGLARAVCHANKRDLVAWRTDLERTLGNVNKPCEVPWTFPDFKALDHYRSPVVSTSEQLHDLRGLRGGWAKKINQLNLRVLLRERFNIWTRGYIKHIVPILLARRLASASSPQQRTENLELSILLKRTRKVKPKDGEEVPAKSELKIVYSPTLLTEIDLSVCPPEEDWSSFAAKDGTPYDPMQIAECELLECILKRGLPDDSLQEVPAPARGKRKRTADEEDDHLIYPPNQPCQSSAPEAGSPNIDRAQKKPRASKKVAAPTGSPSAKKKSKGKKAAPSPVEARLPTPTPPPATFQRPRGLSELRARAIEFDESDHSVSEAEDIDAQYEADILKATMLSLDVDLLPTPRSQEQTPRALSKPFGDSSAVASASSRFQPGSVHDTFPSEGALLWPSSTDSNAAHSSLPRREVEALPLPGEAISRQALRELRASSILLKDTPIPVSASIQKSKSIVQTPAPEVIDLT